jgi:hypothetical protein
MKQEIKKEWIKRLRSGKIKQTTRVLGRTDGSRCCLGVLCDIFVGHKLLKCVKRSGNTAPLEYGQEHELEILPREVLTLAGLTENNPKVKPHIIKKNNQFKGSFIAELSVLNDNDYTFKQIADIIEAEL